MNFRFYQANDCSAIEGLFVATFSESEGEEEGLLIGNLAREMMVDTDHRDLYGFVAVDAEQLVAAIFFSRLTFEHNMEAFILAPVAVHPDYQGKGIGQALIRHGLRELTRQGIEFVATYGDPAFYAKVGFQAVSQNAIQAPHELSQPEGWLGQSLTDKSLAAIRGRCDCVQALDNPAYW